MNQFRPRVTAKQAFLHSLEYRRRGVMTCRPSKRRTTLLSTEERLYMALTSASAGEAATAVRMRFIPGARSDMTLVTAVFAPTLVWALAKATWSTTFVFTPALSTNSYE